MARVRRRTHRTNPELEEAKAIAQLEEAEPGAAAHPLIPLPLLLAVSGLYEAVSVPIMPVPMPMPSRPIPPIPFPMPGGVELDGLDAASLETAAFPRIAFPFAREDLRLDVDARYPQMCASGTLYLFFKERIHWIADLVKTASNRWSGPIWYKDPSSPAGFPYTQVEIIVNNSLFPANRKAVVRFTGAGATRVRHFAFRSRNFRPIEFEYDFTEGVAPTQEIGTYDHPNRPAGLADETLSIDTVFRRAGFDVKGSPGGDVPLAGAGPNAKWSDAELHDAMATYWSRFANVPQWSFWTLFAALHDQGTSLGGIMFDDIGPQHRQGCAIFVDSFIKQPPTAETHPAEWVKRMIFWTACHEMGHCFNLAHSWQKSLGAPYGNPWIPLADEPLAGSFMNYPYGVPGGESAFFSTFEFRFSDAELLFLRHAPARFVRQGDAPWFEDHGFEQALRPTEPALKLELRANRERPVFEFLEPVMLELKLSNVSSIPVVVDERTLASASNFTLVVKRHGATARQYSPFAHYCFHSSPRVLEPGQAMYEPVFVAGGTTGWLIDEPGRYTVQAALHLGDDTIVSEPLHLRVAPARGYEEEEFAQDYLSPDVARVLYLDGSRATPQATDVLRTAAERFPDRRASLHARVALGLVNARPYKLLRLEGEAERRLLPAVELRGEIEVLPAHEDEARELLAEAVAADPDTAAETLGHIEYKQYADTFTAFLEEQGETKEAGQVQMDMLLALSSRGVLESVLDGIRKRARILGADEDQVAAQPRQTRSRRTRRTTRTRA